jgi:hypothetical protein
MTGHRRRALIPALAGLLVLIAACTTSGGLGPRADRPADDGTVDRTGPVRRDAVDPALTVGVAVRVAFVVAVAVAVDAGEWRALGVAVDAG